MAYTLLGAVYVPLQFTREIIQLTTKKSALWQSGIIGKDPQLAGKAAVGGRLVEMPYWNDLTGNSEPINSGTTLTVNAITGDKDQAVIGERGKVFGSEDIAGILAQSDPMSVVQERISTWWANDLQDTFISILKGIFGAASMAGLVSAIHHTSSGAGSYTEVNTLNAFTAIDAAQLLGDRKDKLTAWVMHSAVQAALEKQDEIETIRPSEGGEISMFRGRRVIVDDRCPTSTVDGDTIYTSYLFGEGAFGYEEDPQPRAPIGAIGTWAYEELRVPLQGLSGLITRKRFLLHPRGIKWTDVDGDTSPTNTQFENQANWLRKYDVKNLRVAAVTHNVDPTGTY